MPFGKKIVLHIPLRDVPGVDDLIEKFIQDGVRFVAEVGKHCAEIEDMIDAAAGGGSDSRFILNPGPLQNRSWPRQAWGTEAPECRLIVHCGLGKDHAPALRDDLP